MNETQNSVEIKKYKNGMKYSVGTAQRLGTGLGIFMYVIWCRVTRNSCSKLYFTWFPYQEMEAERGEGYITTKYWGSKALSFHHPASHLGRNQRKLEQKEPLGRSRAWVNSKKVAKN